MICLEKDKTSVTSAKVFLKKFEESEARVGDLQGHAMGYIYIYTLFFRQ